MKHKSVHPEIIRHPEMQPRGQHAMFRLITVCAWVIWFYLLLPLLSLVAWLFGIEYARRYVIGADDLDMMRTLAAYGLFVVMAGVTILAWSRYNRFRFPDGNRHPPVPPVTPEMKCERFGVESATLQLLHTGKVLKIEIDDEERICRTWVEEVA